MLSPTKSVLKFTFNTEYQLFKISWSSEKSATKTVCLKENGDDLGLSELLLLI